MATKLGDLLNYSVNKAGIGQQVSAAQICTAFDRLIIDAYPKIKDQAQAKFVKNGTLTVAVLSPIIGQEIKLHERDILENLQKKFGKKAVSRLRFLV